MVSSLVVYNVKNNYIGDCIFITDDNSLQEGYSAIRDRTVAGWNNGDMIFLIPGDWRQMKANDIKEACLNILTIDMTYSKKEEL